MKKIDLICMIDDDEIYTSIIQRIIEHAGVANRTMFFRNGQDALDFFLVHKDKAEELPELILLDINMPILDGWQFMEGFGELNPYFARKITVYMTSSSTDEDDYNRAISTKHVVDLIGKPIYVKVLQELVQKL